MKAIKFLYIGLLATAFTACTKNFEEINTPPKDPVSASNEELFNGIISSLPLAAGEYSVMNSWIYSITQQGVVEGNNHYNFDNARNGVWDPYYSAMASSRLLESRIAESANVSAMNNFSAMIKTLIAYKTFKVTNYFGNIPYSKAGYAPIKKAEGYNAAYEKQEDIYKALLADLKWAVDNFNPSSDQYSPQAYDTFFKGDVSKWSRFANSLRLYIAVTMYDKNPTLAQSHITESLNKPLLGDGEDIGLWPAQIPGLSFQWRSWSFVQDCNLRLGSTMWNLLSDNDNTDGSGIFDIRAKIFFETNDANEWKPAQQNAALTETGSPYKSDKRNSLANWADKQGSVHSSFNFNIAADLNSIPELMLTSAQIQLLKAEIYNRGLGVAADQNKAQSAYEAGIKNSLNMWKKIAFNAPNWFIDKPTQETVTNAELNKVLNNVKVKYDASSPATSLLKIYAQLWIDQYRQPFDAWTLLRRTGGKTPKSTINPNGYQDKYGNLNRFRYPDGEQSYNNANWKNETQGSDLTSKKIWIQP